MNFVRIFQICAINACKFQILTPYDGIHAVIIQPDNG